MIRIIQGRTPGKKNDTLAFDFRYFRFTLNDVPAIKDAAPYIGCCLNKENVIKLRDWLTETLEASTICDVCYYFEIPDNLKGSLKCSACDNVISK